MKVDKEETEAIIQLIKSHICMKTHSLFKKKRDMENVVSWVKVNQLAERLVLVHNLAGWIVTYIIVVSHDFICRKNMG